MKTRKDNWEQKKIRETGKKKSRNDLLYNILKNEAF